MNIILFGMPTSGKGTQSKLLSKEYNIPHISTGDILRDNMEKKTPLGIKINEIMRAGGFASDEDITNIMDNKLAQLNSWILDGYPRTLTQAKSLEYFIEKKEIDAYYIFLHINENEALKRSQLRYLTQKRFEDASDDVIKTRIKIYFEKTQNVVEYFSNNKNFLLLDGLIPQEEIFKKIKVFIKK